MRVRATMVATALLILALALPSQAAAACTNSWTGNSNDGNWFTAGNWSQGHAPTNAEDACIGDFNAGTYTVTLAGGGPTVASLTVGGTSGTQTLKVSPGSLTATTVTVSTHGVVLLDVSAGASLLKATGSMTNAGRITTVGPSVSGDPQLQGNLVNTGTLEIGVNTIYTRAGVPEVTLDNRGPMTIANAATLDADGNSTVINGTGGSITSAGNGLLYKHGGIFEQGAGTASGTSPVVMCGGTLSYTGAGSGPILVTCGGGLAGNLSAGQVLTIKNGAANTNLSAVAPYTNAGTIRLDIGTGGVSLSSGPPGGAGLTNTGTISTVGVPPGGSDTAAINGNLLNKGAIQIGTASGIGRPIGGGPDVAVDNQGSIAVANGSTLTAGGDVALANNTGGSITGTGTGRLFKANGTFTQGAGTTSGVAICDGTLAYTGTAASDIAVLCGTNLSGNISAGQTVRISSTGPNTGLRAGTFTNAGSILLDVNSGGVFLSSTGTLTNTGTIVTQGAQPNGGPQITGTFVNSGTFEINTDTQLLNGTFTQTASGIFDTAVNGTMDNQFNQLFSVDSPALGGLLRIDTGGGYDVAAVLGETVAVIAYNGNRTGTFCGVTAVPPLTGGKGFVADYTTPGQVRATVAASPAANTCPPPGPPANTGRPQITGNAAAGQTLGCSAGTWTNGPTSYGYSWNRDGTPITGATASTYKVTDADAGRSLTCTVAATNSAGTGVATSLPVLAAGTAPPASTPTPTVTTTPEPTPEAPKPPELLTPPTIEGELLSPRKSVCKHGTWANDPTSYKYRWDLDGAPDNPIASKAGIYSLYIWGFVLYHRTMTCTVTATNAAGSTTATATARTGRCNYVYTKPNNTGIGDCYEDEQPELRDRQSQPPTNDGFSTFTAPGEIAPGLPYIVDTSAGRGWFRIAFWNGGRLVGVFLCSGNIVYEFDAPDGRSVSLSASTAKRRKKHVRVRGGKVRARFTAKNKGYVAKRVYLPKRVLKALRKGAKVKVTIKLTERRRGHKRPRHGVDKRRLKLR